MKKNQAGEPVSQEKLVFGFDLGTGSIGCAVRLGENIVHSRVYLFDQDFASTKLAAQKRRLYRTRLAHRAREYLLNQICESAGIPVLKKIEATSAGDYRAVSTDPRLKREFGGKGDHTIYTSSLLRILLLEGKEEQLEPWQIYKALHSAIQRRGYGSVPWAQNGVQSAKEEAEKSEKEELENQERSAKFDAELTKISANPDHHYIPYFIAFRMGLWNPTDGISGTRVRDQAQRASLLQGLQYQGITASRETVERELKKLLIAAKRKFPQLDVEEALYGLHRKPFQRLNDLSEQEKLAYTRSWQGLLGQKVPRFDNRILASCALIPRMHVARSSYEKNPLHSELHLILALHRLRPLEVASRRTRSLKPDELRTIFEEHLKKTGKKGKPTFKFTPNQLNSALRQFGLIAAPGATEIPEPKTGGRSRFSRPGAYLLKKLILSGNTPKKFLSDALAMPCSSKSRVSVQENQNPNQGLIKSDLKWIELIQDQPWEGVYVPDIGALENAQLKDIVKDLRNPVVRHRVEFFEKVLRDLCSWSQDNFGRSQPDQVSIELVREKLSEKKKTERDKFNKGRKKERDEARAELDGAKVEGNQLVRKYMMAKAQDWKNLFPESGSALQKDVCIQQKDLPNYTIEHILPRSKGGPDAFWNLVLCPMHINREKGERTPRDWLESDPDRWNLFVKRVNDAKNLHPKTRQLLLCSLEQAQELSDKYSQLAGTAWIARLARRVIFSTLNWNESQDSGRKVIFVNGGLTAKLRRKYRLNALLNPSGEDEKNRDTPLHHALDACVVSFIEHQVNPDLSEKNLVSIREKVFSSQLRNSGPRASLLEENFYGKRRVRNSNQEFDALVWKVPLPDLAIKQINMKPTFDLDYLEGNIRRIYPTPDMQKNHPPRDLLAVVFSELQTAAQPDQTWKNFCERQLKTPGGVRRVTLYEVIKEGLSELKLVTPEERGSAPNVAPQVLKPKGTHLGQFIVKMKDIRGADLITVRPLYVHEVESIVRKRIAQEDGQILFFVRSGDYLVLPEGTEDGKMDPGVYKLNSLRANGQIALTDLLGVAVPSKPVVAKLLKLGLRPVTD